MILEVFGVKLIGSSLQGAAYVMQKIGKLSGLSDEDLEVEKIKTQREYRRRLKLLRLEDKAWAERYWDKSDGKQHKRLEMRKRAYARVLTEEQEERR